MRGGDGRGSIIQSFVGGCKKADVRRRWRPRNSLDRNHHGEHSGAHRQGRSFPVSGLPVCRCEIPPTHRPPINTLIREGDGFRIRICSDASRRRAPTLRFALNLPIGAYCSGGCRGDARCRIIDEFGAKLDFAEAKMAGRFRPKLAKVVTRGTPWKYRHLPKKGAATSQIAQVRRRPSGSQILAGA